MRKTFNNSAQPVSFKGRRLTGYKVIKNLRYGDSGLAFTKNYTIEKLQFTFLKKKLKIFLKSKNQRHIKTWFFLAENYPIFKKGKNARMGKGKGIYQRLSYRLKKNQIFIEFHNLNVLFLSRISNMLKLSANLRNVVVRCESKYTLILSGKNISFYKLYRRF